MNRAMPYQRNSIYARQQSQPKQPSYHQQPVQQPVQQHYQRPVQQYQPPYQQPYQQPIIQQPIIQQQPIIAHPQPPPNMDIIVRDGSLFAPISLMDVNDRIERFQKTETDMQQQFEQQQKAARDKFAEEQQKRRKLFDREIEKFEHSNNDPYKILGINRNSATLQDIKAAYKNLARKNHPDKGGNAEKFKLITQSYFYLMNKYGKSVEDERKMRAPVEKQDYVAVDDGMQNIHVSKDQFDVKKFNDVFERFKVEDVYDEGYGNMMSNEPARISVGAGNATSNGGTLFTDKFNKEMFNKMFENENINDELVVYEEPEALDSSRNLAYRELGQEKITDFGDRGSNKFTDYKRAYDKNHFNPNKVKYREYKTVDELKRDRANVSHEMTDETRDMVRRREERETERERKRKEKMERDEEVWKTQYEKLNRLFIKN